MVKWYFHWKSSRNGRRSPLGDGLPWMTYETIDWLSGHLTKEQRLFEWGSGGSTMFFSHHVKDVFTVEHDPVWYQTVVKTIKSKYCNNISITLVEPAKSTNIDPWYMSTSLEYKDYSFQAYISTIDIYPDAFFDVVVVDGRARPGCMGHALPKIKPGGYLILDNSERALYKMGKDLLADWKNVLTINGAGPYSSIFWETRIWQKIDPLL